MDIMKPILNSAVLYAVAFNLIFFIQELFLALGKRWLGLKAFLYHNNHNWEGSHPKDQLAQGYGALAIFITGIIFLLLFLRFRKNKNWIVLFFIWMTFHGFMQSLPQVVTAIIEPGTDVGQAFTYLGVTTGMGVFLSFISTAGMIFIAWLCAGFLLGMAPEEAWQSSPARRFRYLSYIALIPSLIGILLIIPFRIMPYQQIMAPVMITLVSVPWVMAHAFTIKSGNTIDNQINHRLFVFPVIALILLLTIFQGILAKGVEM